MKRIKRARHIRLIANWCFIGLLFFTSTWLYNHKPATEELSITSPTQPDVEAFIAKWQNAGGSEQGASQMFLIELCDILNVPHPDAPHPYSGNNIYVFEKRIVIQHTEGAAISGRIDLYKQGCFIWESKQGSAPEQQIPEKQKKGAYRHGMAVRGTLRWNTLMGKARIQAEAYAHSLSNQGEQPPFILIADIGYLIELFADFSGNGMYVPFPASNNRIYLEDLRKEEVRDCLRRIWTDPLSLNPSGLVSQ